MSDELQAAMARLGDVLVDYDRNPMSVEYRDGEPHVSMCLLSKDFDALRVVLAALEKAMPLLPLTTLLDSNGWYSIQIDDAGDDDLPECRFTASYEALGKQMLYRQATTWPEAVRALRDLLEAQP